MKTFIRLFIIFGIFWCLLGGYYLFLRYQPNNLQFNYTDIHALSKQNIATTSSEQQTGQTNLPRRIVIDNLRINLPIIPAGIHNDVWETNYKGVSYLSSSPIPGSKGNSIMYGHNWTNLFGNLTHAVPGQTVDIYYADGSKKRFVIEYTSVVSPSESSILADSDDTRITLYTCTGFLDSKRFVAVALLSSNQHSFAEIPYK